MVDYYKLLGINTKASTREIKSAYRRLARKMHPDLNGNSEKAARDFALISKAYQILSDPQERAFYDKQRLQTWSNTSGDIYTNNPHAQRLRRLAIQARMDKAVDKMFEAERQETFQLQQAVYPTVTLFLSTFFAAMLKPSFWHSSGNLGKATLLVLFGVGSWHLVKRFRLCFERYTHQPSAIHDSIINDEAPEKPFTPLSAFAYLLIGVAVSFAIGTFMNGQLQYLILQAMPFFFDQVTRPELMFYPPIAVLIVDTMHSIAAKLDG